MLLKFIIQKQPFTGVLKNRCSSEFCKFDWKTPVLRVSFLNKVAGLSNTLKKFASRTPSFKERLWWLHLII